MCASQNMPVYINDPVVINSINSNGDIYLWPNDSKINRVLPLPQENHVAKFGKDPIYRTKVIVWKPVWTLIIPKIWEKIVEFAYSKRCISSLCAYTLCKIWIIIIERFLSITLHKVCTPYKCDRRTDGVEWLLERITTTSIPSYGSF